MVAAAQAGARELSSSAPQDKGRQAILDQLRKLFVKAKLPSSPVLASRILSLAADPDATIDQFAKVIQMDGALAARLLKMANSACMALVTPATTIQRAVMVLGLGRVRTAALGFQLVGHLNKLGGKRFDIKAYWKQSVLRGCVGREIARVVAPGLAEEAFLIGLLCDGGILLLVQLLGPEYAALYETGGLSPAAFYAAEKGRFPYDHADAISAMAAEWNLPEAIQKPLAQHHFPTRLGAGAGPADRLCALAYLVGSLCFTEDLSPNPSADRLAAYALEQFGLSPDDLQKCLLAAGESYKQASELLGDALPDDLDVTELLGEANRQLTAAAGEAEERVHDVESQRDQIKSALGEYRERAARDPLTGLLNRGALADVAAQHLADARGRGMPVSCFFLDLDDFKRVNDEHNHQTGDHILQAVAAALPAAIINTGSIGRYGGEEFVAIITGLRPDESEAKARQLVEIVRGIDYVPLGLKARITCSVGAVWGNSLQFESADALFAAADEQMYIAKKSGKDRAVYKNFTTENTKKKEAIHSTVPTVSSVVNSAAAPHLDSYRRIAEQLHRAAPAIHGDHRKQSRSVMLTPCFIRLLAGSNAATAAGITIEEPAYVRNFSPTGVGVLASRSMARGDAVEVTICSPGKPPRALAGVVAFCRHVEGAIHDIGIQFSA
ncbi:MAG TPA: GGDEF domain-containing protein [Phycisphaerae bacterium]|nr:GGDEF domain-containing protein [Phycisphaerae bacterium]